MGDLNHMVGRLAKRQSVGISNPKLVKISKGFRQNGRLD